MIAVLTSGLTLSILVPSAAATLQQGVNNYANTAGTYMDVAPTGFSPGQNPGQKTLPPSVVDEIRTVDGVQQTYPLVTNYTSTTYYNVTVGGYTLKSLNVSTLTAVLGGAHGFPPSLVQVVEGRLPGHGKPEFILFSNTPNSPPDLGKSMQMEVAGMSFNATLVGVAASSAPITGNIGILLDQSFVAGLLGPTLFNSTFGGSGSNYVIVKANSISLVNQVATEVAGVVKDYPVFQTNYDLASAMNLKALITQTAPLYEALGILSFGITVLAALFVAWLGVRRRSWEAAMLVTQGWRWAFVSKLYIAYFLALAAVSYSLALAASFLMSPFVGFNLQLYGQQVGLQTSPQSTYIILSLVLAVALSLGGAVLVVRSLRRRGLDDILREY